MPDIYLSTFFPNGLLTVRCANKIRNGFDCKYKLKFSIRLALQDIMSDLEQDDMFKRYIL